jgi:NADH-quinone oxidoreductase subunit N
MISLGYYLPVIAAMWMREAPAGEAQPGGQAPQADAPAPAGALPALAGGSAELDAEEAQAGPVSGPQPEVALVAVLAGAATIFFGIVPQPLFDLVHGAGGALGLL